MSSCDKDRFVSLSFEVELFCEVSILFLILCLLRLDFVWNGRTGWLIMADL